jgi:hypothetical protein
MKGNVSGNRKAYLKHVCLCGLLFSRNLQWTTICKLLVSPRSEQLLMTKVSVHAALFVILYAIYKYYTMYCFTSYWWVYHSHHHPPPPTYKQTLQFFSLSRSVFDRLNEFFWTLSSFWIKNTYVFSEIRSRLRSKKMKLWSAISIAGAIQFKLKKGKYVPFGKLFTNLISRPCDMSCISHRSQFQYSTNIRWNTEGSCIYKIPNRSYRCHCLR